MSHSQLAEQGRILTEAKLLTGCKVTTDTTCIKRNCQARRNGNPLKKRYARRKLKRPKYFRVGPINFLSASISDDSARTRAYWSRAEALNIANDIGKLEAR